MNLIFLGNEYLVRKESVCEKQPMELNCSYELYYNSTTRTCRPFCSWAPYLTYSYFDVTVVVATFSYSVMTCLSLVYFLCAFTIQRHL